LSHDQHPDNLDIAGRSLLATVERVLSTPDAATRVTGVTGLIPWQQTRIPSSGGGSVLVTAVPALHGPDGAEAFSGVVTGFVLESDQWPTIYVSGDNASTEIVRAIAERFPQIEVAILFAGAANVGRFGDEPMTLDSRGVMTAAASLEGAMIVPVHAEGWAHFSEPIGRSPDRG
jgi:hypothetical protein